MPPDLSKETYRAATPETRDKIAVKKDTVTAEIRRVMAEKKTDSPVQGFADAVAGMDVLDRDTSKTSIADNIGVEFDSSGNKILTSEQEALKTRAESFEEVAGIFLVNGYDSPEFAAFQDQALNSAEAILKADPEIATLIPIDPAAKKVFLEAYLKDSRFIALVRKGYSEKISNPQSIEDPVTQAAIDFEAAKKADEDMQRQIARTKDKIRDLQDTVRDFEPGGRNTMDLERYSQRLSSNRARGQRAERELMRIEDRIARLEQQRDMNEYLGRSTDDIEAQIESLEVSRGTQETIMTTTLHEISEYERLSALKTTSKTDLEKEEDNLEEYEGKQPDLARNRAIKQTTLRQARVKRGDAERKYVRGLDVMSSALIQFQKDRLSEAEEARKEVARKREEDTDDRAQKALARYDRKRWSKSRDPHFYDKRTEEPDKEHIEEDLGTAFSLEVGKGPDQLVRAALEAGLAEEVAAKNMTKDEAKAYIDEKMKDKDFVTGATPQLLENLFAAAISSGRKFTDGELKTIRSSDWGPGLIQKALDQNKDVQQMFEKAKEQGVIKGDLREAIQKDPNLLAILLLALGGVVTAAAGAPLIGVAALGASGGGAMKRAFG